MKEINGQIWHVPLAFILCTKYKVWTQCYASYLHWRHAICSTCFVTEFIKFYGKQVRVAPGLTASLPVIVINIFRTLGQNFCSIAENKTRKTRKEFDKCRVKMFLNTRSKLNLICVRKAKRCYIEWHNELLRQVHRKNRIISSSEISWLEIWYGVFLLSSHKHLEWNSGLVRIHSVHFSVSLLSFTTPFVLHGWVFKF